MFVAPEELPFDCAVVENALRHAKLVTTWAGSDTGSDHYVIAHRRGDVPGVLQPSQRAAVLGLGAYTVLLEPEIGPKEEYVVWDAVPGRFLGMTEAQWRYEIVNVYNGSHSEYGWRHNLLWLRMGKLFDWNPNRYLWLARKHEPAAESLWRPWALEIEIANRVYAAERQESS